MRSAIVACAAVKEFKDRFVPFKGYSPLALQELHEMGVKLDIIYIDAMKIEDDLVAANKLFPNAVLCGDDWTWGEDEGFPMRKAVTNFANNNGYRIKAKRATSILEG